MALLDELLPDLSTRISQVPAFIGRNMLRKAVQQFCQESQIWQHTQTVTLSDDRRYPLPLPEGTVSVGIVAAARNGEPLRQGFDYELGFEHDLVMLKNRGSGEITLLQALKPHRQSDEIPDMLLDHYSLAITAGAAAWLGENEKQAWALSKRQIESFQEEFEAGYRHALKFALNNASRLYEAPTRHEFF